MRVPRKAKSQSAQRNAEIQGKAKREICILKHGISTNSDLLKWFELEFGDVNPNHHGWHLN